MAAEIPSGAGNSLTIAIAPFAQCLRGKLAPVHTRARKRKEQKPGCTRRES